MLADGGNSGNRYASQNKVLKGQVAGFKKTISEQNKKLTAQDKKIKAQDKKIEAQEKKIDDLVAKLNDGPDAASSNRKLNADGDEEGESRPRRSKRLKKAAA